MTVWVVKQFLNGPQAKLFPNLHDIHGVKKIEKLSKLQSFSINNLDTLLLIGY
jgi:hypothetical protein